MSKSVVAVLQQAHVLMWPSNMDPTITPRATPTLSSTVLNLVDAANRAETVSALQATAAKLNEVIALLNASRA